MRQHHWIMSLLDDLETYATLNDLPLIKDRIAAAKTTAKEEIIVKSVQAADEQSGLRDGIVVPLHVYGTR